MWLIKHFCIFPVSKLLHMVGIGINPHRIHVDDHFPTPLAIITICWERSPYMSHIWIYRSHIWSSDELQVLLFILQKYWLFTQALYFGVKKGPHWVRYGIFMQFWHVFNVISRYTRDVNRLIGEPSHPRK